MKRGKDLVESLIMENDKGLVVDVGCGSGWVKDKLCARSRYVGLDYPATKMLGYVGPVDIYGDGRSMPLADNVADVVLLLDVLEHVDDAHLVLDEVSRVLKPGGSVIVKSPFIYPVHDAPHDFTRWTEYGLGSIFGKDFRDLRIYQICSDVRVAAMLFGVALSFSVFQSLKEGRFWVLLLVPIAVFLITTVNLSAFLWDALSSSAGRMPASYVLVARR